MWKNHSGQLRVQVYTTSQLAAHMHPWDWYIYLYTSSFMVYKRRYIPVPWILWDTTKDYS